MGSSDMVTSACLFPLNLEMTWANVKNSQQLAHEDAVI